MSTFRALGKMWGSQRRSHRDQGEIHGGYSQEEDISELLREKGGLLGREPH